MIFIHKLSNIISKVDLSVAKFANNTLHKFGNLFTIFMRIYTTLGNNGFIFGIVMLPMFFFKTTREGACLIFFAMLYGYIITNILLKNTFARPRPFMRVSSQYHQWWEEAGSLQESGFSFPSGHTTAAMAFAVVMFYFCRKDVSWLFFIIPILMAFSRIYFMVHYLSDVAVALIMGAICAIFGIITVHYLVRIESLMPFFNFPSVNG